MNLLAEALKYEVERHGGLRAVGALADLSHSLVDNLINRPDVVPSLRTLQKVALFLKLPLWRVVEMAGFDLELANQALLTAHARVCQRIEGLTEREVGAVDLYLDVLLEQRKRHG